MSNPPPTSEGDSGPDAATLDDAAASSPPPAGPGPRPRRRPSPRRRALFALVLLAGALLVGEVLARLLGPGRAPPPTVAHPYLRHVRSPGASLDLIHPTTGRRYRVSIDEEGFRSRGLVRPKPAGQVRVFFVGGSTTENIAVPDEETFPDLVEVGLNQRLGAGRARAVNTAIAGNSIADSFSLVSHRVLALEPDLVVVMHAINDMRAACSARFDPAHYADRLAPPEPRPADLLERYSELYRLTGRARARLTATSREERYRRRARERPYSEGVDPGVGLPYFRRYLGLLDAVCREAGVRLVLMTQPSLYKPELSPEERAALWMGYVNHGELNLSPETLREGMARFNAAIREFARERGLLLVDLERAFPKDLAHLYDDCHYTARGNAVIADAILAALRDLPAFAR